MKIEELIILLPCHSLDDFPTNLSGADADGLLAAWSALWHPALVAAAGKMMTWRRAEFLSDALSGKLIVVPPVVEQYFSGDLEIRAKNEGAAIVRGHARRDEIVAACLAVAESGVGSRESGVDAPASPATAAIPPELVQDFLAFGTVHLQSELLVRRMRYTSTLDDGRLQTHVVAAATAAANGQVEEAKQNLGLCAGVLLESRGRFYPVDTSILDLTLVAPTTVGASLRQELAGAQPINLLISGETLDQLAGREPESLAAIKQALSAGNLTLVGGEWSERETPLLPLETILDELKRGLRVYEQRLGARPVVFGRRRYGLTSALPRILSGLGFRAALHFTLDDGKFPTSDSAKTRWEGFDGATIEAIGRAPLDARQSATFISLAEKIGHAMDHDHVATVMLAHWPSQTSPFYDDLRRAQSYAPVFGKFATLEHYFATTDASGGYSRFSADEYRSPYLQQAVAAQSAKPLSQWTDFYRQYAIEAAAGRMVSLAEMLRQKTTGAGDEKSLDAAVAQFTAALPRQRTEPARGVLALNPLSYSRRLLLDVSALSQLPAVAGPIRAAEELSGQKRVVIDVPPMGFAWIAPSAEPGQNWNGSPIADGQILRNEFCEVTIHPQSGGIQSVHDFRNRGNRLSQQLVWRTPAAPADTVADDAEASFSRMQVESIDVTDSGLLRGEITSRGQLVDPTGKRLAGFTQRVQMTLGSRLVTVEIELDPVEPLAADPWNAYIASRFAWSDTGADLRRSQHLQSHVTRGRRLESPHFTLIEATTGRTALFSAGLPYHRRVGNRMLDTLLHVAGETTKTFRLGFGLDIAHPWSTALDLMAPQVSTEMTAAAPAPVNYGWLFSIDAKNVLATHWAPLVEPSQSASGEMGGSQKVVGMRCRLLEAEGRTTLAQLRCFRNIASAQMTDFLGAPAGMLSVKEDRVSVDLAAYQWVELEARWA